MPPGINGESRGNDPFPVMQGRAHRGSSRIETKHKHADQPSARAARLSQIEPGAGGGGTPAG